MSKHLTYSQWGATVFGTVAIGYGARAILAPFEFAEAFGHPQPIGGPGNPFVAAMGGRTAAMGLAIVTLSLLGNTKASGVILMSCVVSGLTDTFSTYSTGDRGAVGQHAIGTVVLGGLGWYLFTTE